MQEKSTYDKGTEYEDFVAAIYKSILAAEQLDGRVKGITLERLKLLPCKSGTTTKVDIYWEYEVAETTFRTVIECKNYEGRVPVDDLREFTHKLSDIVGPPVQGLCIAKYGFQSGAEKVADHDGIKLINLREVEEKDWEGYMKGIDITYHILSGPRILNIEPILNGAWKNKMGYKTGDRYEIVARSDEIFIEDIEGEFKKSLQELMQGEFITAVPGRHIWEQRFSKGILRTPTAEYEINAIKITYHAPRTLTTQTHIDVTKHISAVLEYIGESAQKFVVTREGKRLPDLR